MSGIEDFNIVTYTSILPPEATEIPIGRAKSFYHPGAVMEAIIAEQNGHQGERICTGIGTIQVRRKFDGELIAGYVAEYAGNGDEEEAKKSLHIYLMY